MATGQGLWGVELGVATSIVQSNRRFSAGWALRATANPSRRSWAMSLVDSTGSSALGLAFWVVAAHRFPAADVGRAAAFVALTIALADVTRLGVGAGVKRLLRRAVSSTHGSKIQVYGLVVGLASGGAVVFVAGLGFWAPKLISLRDPPLLVLIVVVAAGAWAIFRVQVTVLPTVRRPAWLPVEHAALGGARVLLLIPLSGMSGSVGTFGVLLAWLLPVPFIVGYIAVAVDRLLPGPGLIGMASQSSRWTTTNARLDRTGTAARSVVVTIILLIIVAADGLERAAYFIAAWMIADVLYRLASVLAREAILESVPDGVRADRFRLLRTVETMAVAIPVAVIGALIAPWILEAFGSAYADAAVPLLRLLLIAALPTIAIRTLTARLLIDGREAAVLAIEMVTALALVGASWLLIGVAGLSGLGLAWLIVMIVVAAGSMIGQSVWWWAPMLSGSPARLVSSVAGLSGASRRLTERRALNHQVVDTLSVLYRSAPSWRRLWSTADRQAVAVAGHEGRPPLRIEFARSRTGADALARRVSAVSTMNGTEGIADLRTLVPYPIDHAQDWSANYLIESAVSGQPGIAAAGPELASTRVEAVVKAVSQLHAATGERRPLDGEILDQWVTRPLRSLSDTCGRSDIEFVPIRRLLFDGLEGVEVHFARLHGNLRLENMLFEPERAKLTGILGWDWSERGPVIVDWGVLALSALQCQERDDVGMIVSRLLVEPDRFVEHPAFVAALADDGGEELSPRALVLLAWLHYLKPTLLEASDSGMGDYWMARNVQPVLSQLQVLPPASR